MAKRWKSLSPEQKARFKAEAATMQAKREELMQAPLTSGIGQQSAASAGLSRSQRYRLGNARLDTTLQQVSGHPVWQKGLGLWDHISALRKEYILPPSEDVEREFQRLFAYDAKILANGMLPAYEQSCISCGGGVCRKHALYEHVHRIVSLFDGILLQHKLALSRPALVRLAPAPATEDMQGPEVLWMIMGCVGRRPIVHCVILLFQNSAGRLQLLVEQCLPKITTMHRTFLKILRRHIADGGDPDSFAAEVAGQQ